MPPELADMWPAPAASRASRAAHRQAQPADYHRDLRRLVTEWVCFNIQHKDSRGVAGPYYSGVDKVAQLCRHGAYRVQPGEVGRKKKLGGAGVF